MSYAVEQVTGYAESEWGIRPTGRPHAPGPDGYLARHGPIPATIPDSPCDGCPRARACRIRRETCAAFRHYVHANYPRPGYMEVQREQDLRPLKRGRY